MAGDRVSVIANSPVFVAVKPNLAAYPLPGDIVIIPVAALQAGPEHVFGTLVS